MQVNYIHIYFATPSRVGEAESLDRGLQEPLNAGRAKQALLCPSDESPKTDAS